MKTTGTIIKNLREKFGFNQKVLANFLGVKREMISYYETDSREVPLELLEKLSDLFGVELDIFFKEDSAEISTELAFAFRAEELNEKDLEGIASFRKIIRNYQRMVRLEEKND